ncbi:hypothetical protein C4D60_Mb11t17930 [Musa balbisiana]|uniref:Uncharacterized protein n=1 Tax=Musa balbisiana TaxID=52838 RepID=A0A4S8J6K1_MUSBA|nr:hypothetical protein C4D60_Mb11t17930 [Musa balbisiana]
MVEEDGYHVGAHHLSGDVEWRLPCRACTAIDVGSAELKERLYHLTAAVLDGVVEGEGVVKVEPLPHHHQLDKLDVGRVQGAAHPADLVVVVELGGRACDFEGVVVRDEGTAGEGGLETELLDLGHHIDRQVLREHLRRESGLGDQVGAGGPQLVHFLLPGRHQDLHHVLDRRLLHHASQLLLHAPNEHPKKSISSTFSQRADLRAADLGEERELLDAEGPGSGEGVESEVDGSGAMGVPAAAVAAIGAGFVLLRHQRDLPAEHLVADGIHRDHAAGGGGQTLGGPAGGRPRAVVLVVVMVVEEEETRRRGWLGPAEELAEEEAAGGQDAAMGVDEAALHAEGHVAERLPVDEERVREREKGKKEDEEREANLGGAAAPPSS